MNFISKMKRPGATVAGIFSLGLVSVVLLCGAGSAPIENFSPQGAMQADLNAGGHNLTNVGTVTATNVVVSGSLSAANLGSAATNAVSAFAPASGSTHYQAPITLTTTGTSGAATLSGTGTLNIPQYSGGASYAFTAPLTNGSGTVSVATNTSGDPQAFTMPASSVMLVWGDSISTGYGGAGTSACWEYYLSKQFPTMDIYSFGIVGSTSGPVGNTSSGLYLLSQTGASALKWSNGTVTGSTGYTYATLLAGYSGAKFGVAAYGANDALGVNGVTPSAFASNMAGLYSSMSGLGLTVIGTSILPRQAASSSSPTFNQNIYNSLVRQLGAPYVTAGSSRWNLFADVGGAGGLTNPYDTTLFESDAVHPNPAGHELYANVIYRAITNQSVASTGLPPIIQIDSSGNGWLPFTGLTINSSTTPNASSGQILTIGTRGGTGTPLTIDDGTGTVASISGGGVVSANEIESTVATGYTFYGVSSSAGGQNIWADLDTGLSNGGSAYAIPLGKSTSTKQGIQFTYYYSTTANSCYGLFALNNMGAGVSVFGSGDVVLGSTTDDGANLLQVTGNVALKAAGNTILLKGGSNAASGTVTLSSGTGTITSSAITASSVILLSLKASSGTPGAYLPLTTVSTGTCVVSGISTDNSTYNWGEIIVNQ